MPFASSLLCERRIGSGPAGPTRSLDMAGVYLGPYVPPHRHSHSTYLLSSPSVQIDPTANYTAAIMLKLKEGGEDALRSAGAPPAAATRSQP